MVASRWLGSAPFLILRNYPKRLRTWWLPGFSVIVARVIFATRSNGCAMARTLSSTITAYNDERPPQYIAKA